MTVLISVLAGRAPRGASSVVILANCANKHAALRLGVEGTPADRRSASRLLKRLRLVKAEAVMKVPDDRL